jgi:hypothetical protein
MIQQATHKHKLDEAKKAKEQKEKYEALRHCREQQMLEYRCGCACRA